MEKKNNNFNETTTKSSLTGKKNKSKIEKKKIVKPVQSVYLSRTFASKLFIKLCRDVIDPIIICLQTLKYEPENRKQEEIESTIPYLKTLENFSYFINFYESPSSALDLMIKFAKITFYHYHRKNSIIKRPGETNDTFYIILNGSVFKYNLIFEVENITLKQYILYLIQLELINEQEIVSKCHFLNRNIINMGNGINHKFSIEDLVQKSKMNYHDMRLIAKKELKKMGFNSKVYKNEKLRLIPNKENYLKIFDEPGKFVGDEGKNKFHFYVGKYKLSTKLIKGQFFNNISDINLKDDNLYMCETNSDLGEIKQEEYIKNELNKSINQKMRKLFSKEKNNFVLFKGIDDKLFLDNYSNFYMYKKFKKNDKIFIQGGYYTGLYLVLDGTISITTSSGIDKLCNLLFTIVNSIKSFSEYIPTFNPENIIKDFNNLHQSLYQKIRLTHEEYLIKRVIDISTHTKYDILGFYDLFDNKTDLYNFTAECISESALLLFIPRNKLGLILGKELNFLKLLISLVETKIQFVVGKFKGFVHQTIANYKMVLKKSVSIPKMEMNLEYKTKTNNFNIENKNIINVKTRNIFTQGSKRYSIVNNNLLNQLNDGENKNDIIINSTNTKNYNYLESMNNFRKQLKRKEKQAEEMMTNQKNNYNLLYQSSYNKLYVPKKIKINSIKSNLLNNNIFINFRNNFIQKENKTKTYRSVDFNQYLKNQNNNYFSVTTIGANNNNDNNNYNNYNNEINIFNKRRTRNYYNYKALPLINSERNKFMYK